VLVCLAAALPAVAQDRDADEQEAQLQDELILVWQRQSREQFAAEVHELKPEGPTGRFRSRADARFAASPPQFSRAVDSLDRAIQERSPLSKAVKDLDKLAGDLIGYLKLLKVKPPIVNKREFASGSRDTLVTATLESARRAEADLQKAASFLRASEATQAVSIESLRFLQSFHGDLLRLRALGDALKSTARIASN